MVHEDEATRDPKEDSYAYQGGCPHPRGMIKLDKIQEVEEAGGPTPEGFMQFKESEPPDEMTIVGQCQQCGDMVEVKYQFRGVS